MSWKSPKFSGDRRAQPFGRDEVGDDRRAQHVLDRAEGGEQPAEHVEQRDRREARERHDGEQAGHDDDRDLVGDEQHAPVVAVGQRAAEQRHGDERDDLDGAEQAGQEGRSRLDVDLVRQRHQGGLRAQAGDDVAEDEQPQVPRFAQGRDVDGDAAEIHGGRDRRAER